MWWPCNIARWANKKSSIPNRMLLFFYHIFLWHSNDNNNCYDQSKQFHTSCDSVIFPWSLFPESVTKCWCKLVSYPEQQRSHDSILIAYCSTVGEKYIRDKCYDKIEKILSDKQRNHLSHAWFASCFFLASVDEIHVRSTKQCWRVSDHSENKCSQSSYQ